MENELLLKRSVFGGFDRREVMDYINILQSKAGKSKAALRELEDLNEKVAILKNDIAGKEDEIYELNHMIESYKEKIKAKEEEEISASDSIIRESMAYADRYVESAKALAQDITEKTSGQVKDAKNQLEELMSSLSDISDSVSSLYSSLSMIKAEDEEKKKAEDNEEEKADIEKKVAVKATVERERKFPTRVTPKKFVNTVTPKPVQEPPKPKAETPVEEGDTAQNDEVLGLIREMEDRYRKLIK